MTSFFKKLTIDNLLYLIILGIVIVIPVIFNMEVKSTFAMPKLYAFRIFTFAAILIYTYKIFKEGSFTYIQSKFNRYLVTYGGISILTTLFSVQIYASIIGTQGRFVGIITLLNFLCIAFLAVNTIKTKRKLLILIITSVIVAFLLSLYGLMQRFSDPSIYKIAPLFQKIVGDPMMWTQDPTQRVFGTMGHANHFGAYLSFNLMLLISLVLTVKKWWQRGLLAFGGGILFTAIVTTASRGAMMAGLAGLLIYAIFLIKIQWSGIKKRKCVLGGIFIGLLIIGLVFRNPIWAKIQTFNLTQRTVSTIQFMLQGNVPDRVSWWGSSLEMFRDRPILGHGLSTYKDIYNQYRRLDYRVPGDIQDTITPESAHMEYFNILATQGLLGFIGYMLLIGYVVWILMKSIWKGKKLTYRYISTGILAALFTYLAQVLMSFGDIGTLTILYIFLGAGVISVLLTKKDQRKMHHETESDNIIVMPEEHPLENKTIRLRRGKIMVPAILILLAVIFMHFGYRQYRAEFFFKQAKNAFIAKDAQVSWANYKAATEYMPWEYVYAVDYAENIFKATVKSDDLPTVERNFEEIFIRYGRAIEISPKMPYIRANMGLAYLTLADVYTQINRPIEAEMLYGKGIEQYEKSIEIAKNNPMYPYTLAKGLSELDRPEKAIQYFEMALKIREPFQDSYFEIAQNYFKLGKYEKTVEYVNKELAINQENAEAQELSVKVKEKMATEPS